MTAPLIPAEKLRHDLKNQLAIIRGFAEIQVAGESAARLTRQLLAFSRQEMIQPTLIDLNAVVNDMRGMLDRVIRGRQGCNGSCS